ncbi:MAG: flagellar basal body P-ring protein FlgI [bacterium]
MNKKLKVIVIISLFLTLIVPKAAFSVRIKEIASIEGVRDNQLIGYGLVVGLNGTGDKSGIEFTVQSMVNMLKNMGISVNANDVKVKNVAAVVATSTLPPFARVGSKIDVTISSLGDAKSLEGGTLLLTPLKAVNGQIFAIAQGPLSVGGSNKGRGQQNHITVGIIPNGAIVEKGVNANFRENQELNILLNSPDFTTANRVEDIINKSLGLELADAFDAGTIKVNIPSEFKNDYVRFIAQLETLEVRPDSISKVVINERTGTVIMGQDVNISRIAISHGNLSIEISEAVQVSQKKDQGFDGSPDQDEGGKKDKMIGGKNQKINLMLVSPGVKIESLLESLNAIGVRPQDMIAILQAIKAAGALQAELQVM